MENHNFEDIFTEVSKIEKKREIEFKATFEWVNKIAQPEANLIDNMIEQLFDPDTTDAIKEKILHTFNIFLRVSSQLIKEQLWDQRDRLSAVLCLYLSESDKAELVFDCVVIIVNIYEAQYFNGFIDTKFVECIFNGLKLIEDEETLICSIIILIEINSQFSSINDNPFLTVYHEHENSRLFNEVLLKILNLKINNETMLKIFYCLNCIMDKEDKCIFYSNDLSAFIDIVLVKLQTTYKDELKLFALESFERITKYDDYYKEMYKYTELTDLMEDFSEREDQTEVIREKSKKVLLNLVKKIQSKLGNGNEAEESGEDEDEGDEEEEEEEEEEDAEEDKDEKKEHKEKNGTEDKEEDNEKK